MPTKGQKNTKGQPEKYGEFKDVRLSVALTQTGNKLLKQMCDKRDLAVSEFIEQIARGLIPLADETSQMQKQEVLAAVGKTSEMASRVWSG